MAHAQGAGPASGAATLDEIVVTAQRRAESVQDVPIAVTVVTAQQLEMRSVSQVADVLTSAPNVTRTAGAAGGDDANFFVRGIGQLDNSVAVDPGVGIYIDEVYLGRLQGASFDLLDIQRLEVLRGPQGTLWGKNTIGGAINVVSADPTSDAFKANVSATVGSRERREATAKLNVPLGDKAALSVSGIVKRQEGFARSVSTGQTFGDTNVQGARVKLVADLTPNLTVKLAADVLKRDGTPAPQLLRAVNPLVLGPSFTGPPGAPPLAPGLSPLGVPIPTDLGREISTDPTRVYSGIPAIDKTDSSGLSAVLEWDLGNVSLKSITAYRTLEKKVYNEFDGTAYRLYDSYNTLDQHQFSQELQAQGEGFGGKLNWLGGLYYFDESADNLVDICAGTNGPRLTGKCFLSRNFVDIDIKSYAGFANLDYAITDKLSVTAGLRYTKEERGQDFSSYLINEGTTGPGLPLIVPPGATMVSLPPSHVSGSYDKWTPKIGVDYKLNDNVLIYASYAEGFKSGGFTGRPSLSQITAYDPETVKTTEVGLKATLARGLFLNSAVFHSDYQDIQLLVSIPPGLFDTQNAGSARFVGFETELMGRVNDYFQIQASLGYLDAKYTELAPNVSGLKKSNKLPLVSEWTYSIGPQITIPVRDGDKLTLRADYSYRSTFSFQLENFPMAIQKGYGVLNLRAQYDIGDRYSIAVLGLNVADEKYFVNQVDGRNSLGVAIGLPGTPSEWAVQVSARF